MRKYSFEFKKKIVMDYLEGKEGYKRLRKKYGMPDTHQIRTWISSYKKFGDKGIMGSNKNRTYSFEFKLYVVELYLTTEASYREVALSVGIYDPSTIVKWVNDYRKAGIDALRPKRKGMKHTVSRTKKNNPNKDNQEYLKELEEENLRLRIENAFLKEARRMRLEDEAKMRERLDSLAVSEDNSD